MKTTLKSRALLLGVGLFISGCAHKPPTLFQSVKNPQFAAQLKSFVAEKEAQASAIKIPADYQEFFAMAARGDWLAASNVFMELRKQPERGPAWHTVVETWGALEAFGKSDANYSMLFGTNVIASIPAGSIYFGGTDAGRFIITALQKSQVQAEPFFTLAQGALPDATYLDYLRGMYGAKIYIPTDEDSKRIFQDYLRDAAQRRSTHQLKPGEDVTVDADGTVQARGQIALVQLKARLAKLIFDKNPNYEFYVEESFPFDWMYPYLQPHSLIFKINRQTLPGLSDEIVEQDHAYWRSLVGPMIGSWLTKETSVGEVAAFAQKTFGKREFSGFTGDPRFIQNAYSQRMFSKLRSSHAGLYAWRMQHATDAVEKEQMARAADFAFRQAWALCPDSIEVVLRYVALLMEQKRFADAHLVAETASQMPSMRGQEGQSVREVVKEIQKVKQASAGGN
jgi:hypothetical protein